MEREFICQADYFCSDRREEIIRCRDCKHKYEYWDHEWCSHNHNEDGESRMVCAEGFCSWAERVD